MSEKELENELETFEAKVEKLAAKFALKTGQPVYAIFIEYMPVEDGPDAPVAYASLDDPFEGEYADYSSMLDLSPYGARGIN